MKDCQPDEEDGQIAEFMSLIRGYSARKQEKTKERNEECNLASSETKLLYTGKDFWWQCNERNNLEGFSKASNQHIFTCQPRGSQFTVVEDVPDDRLVIRCNFSLKLCLY